jgi:hypothetical protein
MKGPSGHIQSACGLREPPSCACARSGQGDSHSSSCEGLCNLLAANPRKDNSDQKNHELGIKKDNTWNRIERERERERERGANHGDEDFELDVQRECRENPRRW